MLFDLDLIDRSYDEFERNCVREDRTEYYIAKSSYSENNVSGFIQDKESEIKVLLSKPVMPPFYHLFQEIYIQ